MEIDYEPRCDDGTEIPQRLKQWIGWMNDSTSQGSKPIEYVAQTPQLLQQMGFVDVKDQVIRLPYNTWPTNSKEKDIGRWYNVALTEGLEALSLAPLTRVYHWPPEDVRRLVSELKPIIGNRRYHIYNNV